MSLSYTERLAVLALSEDDEVGVDVEDLTEVDFEGCDAVTMAPEELGGGRRDGGGEVALRS